METKPYLTLDERLIEYLKSQGFDNVWRDPSHRYETAVVGRYNGTPHCFYLEVKPCWRGEYFHFKTVHFTYHRLKPRRRKIMLENTHFVMVDATHEYGLMCDGITYSAAATVSKKSTDNVTKRFAEVPTERVIFFRL